MAQASSAVIPMNNLGNSAPTTSAAVKQNSRPPTTSLGVGNLTVASLPQGQPQPQTPVTSSSTTGSSHTNAIIQNQGPNNLGQQSVQIQGHPSPPQSIVYQFAPPCGCTTNVFCHQHAPVSNTNPIVNCVKFLVFWDCGTVGTIIAAVAFVIGTVVSYLTMKLAIWTATKDYIEHCQADEEAQLATAQCRKAAGKVLPPPPFFQYDPKNDTFVRRTLGGTLLGSTESHTYDSSYIWTYALLDHAICWLVLSAICYFALKLPGIRYNPRRPARDFVCRPLCSYKFDREPTQGTTSALINNEGKNTTNMRRRGHNRHNKNSMFPLLEENAMYSIERDENLTRKSLAIRFHKHPLDPSWKADDIRRLPYTVLKPFTFSQIRNGHQRSSRKQIQIHKLMHLNIRNLLGLYGLEISVRTKNAKRISLIDMLFISPLKDMLISFPWETDTIRSIVEKLVRDKDAEIFVKFYEGNEPKLQKIIKKAILSCLDTLRFTGVDSEGKLLALVHIQDSLYLSEFTLGTYSCGDILHDTEETFTVAVITDTNPHRDWRESDMQITPTIVNNYHPMY
ncbi:uncharacterized protein EAF02_006637 [Botrytis sinoallii]|uniref:uncharacterized protein n=1 Tax=Botrytis sinoallii TaxID=1463999 RepID=UPI001901B6A7|nr:uncharacterized protein EAF02_006637 [Botrytis sinoallii]KAF7881949.1 hypothetical protein EAF02_006637 [Botrytis sinoallii]